MDVFDITCDIGDFRGHLFYPQTTYELPKKHHKPGPPEKAWTTAYGCLVTNRLRVHQTLWRLERGLLVPKTPRAHGGGMRMAEWKMSPPPISIRFKTLRCLGWLKWENGADGTFFIPLPPVLRFKGNLTRKVVETTIWGHNWKSN